MPQKKEKQNCRRGVSLPLSLMENRRGSRPASSVFPSRMSHSSASTIYSLFLTHAACCTYLRAYDTGRVCVFCFINKPSDGAGGEPPTTDRKTTRGPTAIGNHTPALSAPLHLNNKKTTPNRKTHTGRLMRQGGRETPLIGLRVFSSWPRGKISTK